FDASAAEDSRAAPRAASRNGPSQCVMIFCRPCVAGLSFRRRVSVRVFLLLPFLSPLVSPPRRTSPASRAAANIQYTVILARLRDCVRLLPTLRADAIGKKLQIRRRRRFGQLHPSRRAKCKGVRFSCEQARAWLQPRLRGR